MAEAQRYGRRHGWRRWVASRARWWLALVVSVAIAGGTGGAYAAFTATTQSAGDAISSGSVALSDDDSGQSLMTLTSMAPGDLASGCINVTYSGSLAAGIRLYGTATGSLASYLTLKITRGSGSGTAPSCVGFTADGTDYIGQGNGVIYSGNFSAFPSSWSAGLQDPSNSAPATWTTSEAHRYKLEVGIASDPAAQNKTASATLSWEARNL